MKRTKLQKVVLNVFIYERSSSDTEIVTLSQSFDLRIIYFIPSSKVLLYVSVAVCPVNRLWKPCGTEPPTAEHLQQGARTHPRADLQVRHFITCWVELIWLTVSRLSILVSGSPLGPMTRFFFFLSFAGQLFCSSSWGHLLWREDGSVICSAIWQWLYLRRTHNHILLSHLRLPSSHVVFSYNSQGLRSKYSNLSPHGDNSLMLPYVHSCN
jgi:hypothetical protein